MLEQQSTVFNPPSGNGIGDFLQSQDKGRPPARIVQKPQKLLNAEAVKQLCASTEKEDPFGGGLDMPFLKTFLHNHDRQYQKKQTLPQNNNTNNPVLNDINEYLTSPHRRNIPSYLDNDPSEVQKPRNSVDPKHVQFSQVPGTPESNNSQKPDSPEDKSQDAQNNESGGNSQNTAPVANPQNNLRANSNFPNNAVPPYMNTPGLYYNQPYWSQIYYNPANAPNYSYPNIPLIPQNFRFPNYQYNAFNRPLSSITSMPPQMSLDYQSRSATARPSRSISPPRYSQQNVGMRDNAMFRGWGRGNVTYQQPVMPFQPYFQYPYPPAPGTPAPYMPMPTPMQPYNPISLAPMNYYTSPRDQPFRPGNTQYRTGMWLPEGTNNPPRYNNVQPTTNHEPPRMMPMPASSGGDYQEPPHVTYINQFSKFRRTKI